MLEAPGGAVPLPSPFYVERSTDAPFYNALTRGDPLVLLQGARQMGKTSLLARGLNQARQRGWKVLLTDFQKFNSAALQSAELFYQTLTLSLWDQLDLDACPIEPVTTRSLIIQFEDFLLRTVLPAVPGRILWAMDEADRLFTSPFASEFFSLLRSIHNQRATEDRFRWDRLSIAIVYATEAHLFIKDINLSPFNIGTRFSLEPFTPAEVDDLNRRYGGPLQTQTQLDAFYRWTGGHPFLVRRSLHELATKGGDFSKLAAQASRDEGIFSDHLRRMLVLLRKDHGLMEIMRKLLSGQTFYSPENLLRLQKVGLVSGTSADHPHLSCQIYFDYFKRHLC